MFGSTHIFAIEIWRKRKNVGSCAVSSYVESGTEKFPFTTFLFIRFLAFPFFNMRIFFFLLDERGRRSGFIVGWSGSKWYLAPSGFHQPLSFPNIQPEPILMTLFVSKIVKRKETSPFSALVDCCWNFRRWHHRQKLIDFTLASCYVMCFGFLSDDTCWSPG